MPPITRRLVAPRSTAEVEAAKILGIGARGIAAPGRPPSVAGSSQTAKIAGTKVAGSTTIRGGDVS